ncbi:anti-sigma factor family protein [Actinophytocola sediminis]
MNPATVSCEIIVGLIGRWHDGALPPADGDAYEQHLLCCPPCLTLAENYRRALGALPTVANTSAVPADLRALFDGRPG